MDGIDFNKLNSSKMKFKSEGFKLKTNEIIMDLSGHDDEMLVEEEGIQSVMVYAYNTHMDQASVTSDV